MPAKGRPAASAGAIAEATRQLARRAARRERRGDRDGRTEREAEHRRRRREVRSGGDGDGDRGDEAAERPRPGLDPQVLTGSEEREQGERDRARDRGGEGGESEGESAARDAGGDGAETDEDDERQSPEHRAEHQARDDGARAGTVADEGGRCAEVERGGRQRHRREGQAETRQLPSGGAGRRSRDRRTPRPSSRRPRRARGSRSREGSAPGGDPGAMSVVLNGPRGRARRGSPRTGRTTAPRCAAAHAGAQRAALRGEALDRPRELDGVAGRTRTPSTPSVIAAGRPPTDVAITGWPCARRALRRRTGSPSGRAARPHPPPRRAGPPSSFGT